MVTKRIAVTGGSGFLGQSVVEHARARGHQAWSFDRLTDNDVLGPLDDLDDATHVIHLAGILGTSELFAEPERAVDVNIKGTLRVLQWCQRHGAGFTGISMPSVFPSVYTSTKIAANHLARAWHNAFDVPVSLVRAYNAYGPRQQYGPGHPQKIVPTFATMAWRGRTMPVWGDGSQTMDMIHVDDVARMMVDATDFGNGETFDAGTGVPVTVNEFVDFVTEVTGSKAGAEYLPMRAGEEPTEIVSGREGWEYLDWQPAMRWNKLTETVRSYA